MAAPKERKQDPCPVCYLNTEADVPLIYRLGSTQPLSCGKGHVFQDREELTELSKQMMEKKRSLEPPKPVEVNVDVPVVVVDPTDPIKTDRVKGIVVIPVDFIRISSLIGHFTDSSSLFGAIFALNQELLDTKELLRRLQDAKVVSGTGQGPRKMVGDQIIEVIIPERHVEPINDIAEANGMDVTRYMNAKIEDGLDSSWYY